MGKERLMAFTDAVLAIIMTILVLELEKPEAATLEALWALKENFFAYALSFFWLGTMWVNLHNEWHDVSQISKSVVWWSVVLLFFSSLIPYAIRFVNVDYNSGVTQGFYGIMLLLVTFSNVGLSRALEKANHHEKEVKADIANSRKRLYLDIGIKVAALVITFTVYPSAMLISVLVTMLLMMIPARRKAREAEN